MNSNKKTPMPLEVKETLTEESAEIQGQLERVWDLIGVAQPVELKTSHVEKAEMLAQMKQKIDSKAVDRAPAKRSGLRLVKTTHWLAIAASFLLIIASGYLFLTASVTESALPGTLAVVELPDGSSVELSSGASITYSRGFGALPFGEPEVRQVKLSGEAFFKVTKSSIPFSVQTFNAEIAVLGTQFNVRAWPDETEKTTVTLSSGRVQVSALKNPDQHVILSESGHQTVVSESERMHDLPDFIDINTVLIWRDSGFAINNETLRSVFAELERRFDVEIMVNDEAISEELLTIMLPRPGRLETILDDICTQKELNYRRTSRGYEIY